MRESSPPLVSLFECRQSLGRTLERTIRLGPVANTTAAQQSRFNLATAAIPVEERIHEKICDADPDTAVCAVGESMIRNTARRKQPRVPLLR